MTEEEWKLQYGMKSWEQQQFEQNLQHLATHSSNGWFSGKGDQNRDTKLGRDADTGNYSMFHPNAIVWNIR